jgi:hypothetical protein
MRKLSIIFVVAALGFGCSVRQTGFTVISTKNVELSRIDLKETNVVRNQTGRDSRLWLLFIPLSGNPKLEDAVNMCLKNGKGDFIINPIVRSTGWSLLLFSYGSWQIKGDVGNSLADKLPEQRMVPSDQ